MKILYLTPVFEVGSDSGSERHFFFCKYLARHGHSVAAITSNVDYKKASVRIPGSKGTVTRRIDGIDIHYVYSYPHFRGSLFRRFIYFVTYFFSSIAQIFRIDKPDVIYAVSTPLTVGLLGYVLSRIRGIPFVFEVTDVWPDAAVVCGIIKNRAIIQVAKWLEAFCYGKAAHIVALTQGIRENILKKGVPAEKVSVITNGVDFSLFSLNNERPTREQLRDEQGYSDRFVAMYMGAHGAYNALDTIVDAAVALKDDQRFLFVLVGDGDAKEPLQNRVRTHGLTNVRFIAPIARSESPALLDLADAFLLPNRKGEFFSANLPNKLFDFLASAKPIIVAGSGETAAVINGAGCGRVVEAEDGAAVAAALRELAQLLDDARGQMGQAGKAYVTEHYDREVLSQNFLQIIQNAVCLKK
jgi:glycosyltransferase involved in cell wall biosynthesis